MTRRGWLLFVTLGVFWGIPYLFIRVAVTELDPVVVAFGRTALGALLLLPFAIRPCALGRCLPIGDPAALYRHRDHRSMGAAGSRRDSPEQLDHRAADRHGADRRRDHLDRHRP